jgi:S-adenosylmethionine hydrolase
MIVLFTDFGAHDIYVPQVKAALLEHLRAGMDIVDLLHSVSNFHVTAGAHLLARCNCWGSRSQIRSQ